MVEVKLLATRVMVGSNAMPTERKISYVCGDASQAYKKVIDEQWSELIDKSLNNDNALSRSEHFGDAKLKKFDRHVIMLRPNIVVIYDELESEIPCDWDLLMHTDKESNKESENRFAYKTPKFSASAHVYASQKIEFTVSNQFGAKPVDFQKKYKAIPDQYHASFKSVSKSKKMRYLSILQCRDNTNELQLIDDNNNGVFEVNDWKIVVDLESNEFSGMKIIGKDSSLFVNHLPESIYGKKVKMPSREASLLIERSGGNISMSIVENLLPAVSN